MVVANGSLGGETIDWLQIFTIALFTSLLAAGTAAYYRVRRLKQDHQTLPKRVSELVGALRSGAILAEEIGQELEQRQLLAQRLKQEIDSKKQLLDLQQPQLEALSQLFRGEIRSEGKRSFRRDVLMNIAFFVAGAVVSVVVM